MFKFYVSSLSCTMDEVEHPIYSVTCKFFIMTSNFFLLLFYPSQLSLVSMETKAKDIRCCSAHRNKTSTLKNNREVRWGKINENDNFSHHHELVVCCVVVSNEKELKCLKQVLKFFSFSTFSFNCHFCFDPLWGNFSENKIFRPSESIKRDFYSFRLLIEISLRNSITRFDCWRRRHSARWVFPFLPCSQVWWELWSP